MGLELSLLMQFGKIGVTIGTATGTSTTVSSSMYGDAWRTLRVFEI